MRLVLLGPPGAGKGTQGQALAAEFGIPHVATGDIIREHIARRTEFGCKIEAAIAAGNFASDEDINYWVARRLAEPDAQAGYILDGFPRDLAQGQTFEDPLDAVFWLDLSEETLIERMAGRWVCLSCGAVYHDVHRLPQRAGQCDNDGLFLVRRPEDALDKLSYRLELNKSQMWPVAEYYATRNLLTRIDGTGDAGEVTQRILASLPAVPLAK